MIFISYRISDANDVVARLDESLSAEFGPVAIFRDKTRLQGGDHWPAEIAQNAQSRKVMLVVMGHGWKSAKFLTGAKEGFPRLSDPEDWVRKEITLSLDAGNIVIPIFLNGAPPPDKGWLGNVGLERLADHQGIRLSTDSYVNDLRNLVDLLRQKCPTLPQGPVAGTPPILTPSWTPIILSPLQPAPHFSGRQSELARLTAWSTSPTTTTRVISLIAPGGTGKTAIAHKTLASLPSSNPFGIFVWSFYTHPQTELFLQHAVRYFSHKEPPKEQGALLPTLQHALSDSTSHLLILDGLELMQSDHPPKGHLQNEPQLKILLRWLADGIGTRTKALITSRYPLPDLVDWQHHGYEELKLEDLDAPAARALFLRRGVKADDVALDALASRFHHHALTLDALGLYLSRFHNGDPTHAPNFTPDELQNAADPKALRLARVLTQYAERLPVPERDLLARLSLFPRGITLEYLGFLVRESGEVAGALVSYPDQKLLSLLLTLQDQGLVFRSDSAEGATFSAHPFLRDFFRTLLGASTPRQVHEALRSRLAPSLESRPSKPPTSTELLDRYERLIELTRLAGKVNDACDLFLAALARDGHLHQVVGDYARGLRICAAFSSDGSPKGGFTGLSMRKTGPLLSHWGLYAESLGDLAGAQAAFERHNELCSNGPEGRPCSDGWVNLALLHCRAGAWILAKRASDEAEKTIQTRDQRINAMLAQLEVEVGLGELKRADLRLAQLASEFPLGSTSFHGLKAEAEMGLRRGKFKIVEAKISSFLHHAVDWKFAPSLALGATILGSALALKDPHLASRHLRAARAFAATSGNREITLRCYLLSAAIARADGNLPLSISEATNGIQLADSCGFGCWSVDLRLELAKTHLADGHPDLALAPAQKALGLSEYPDSQYAWGIADALHLLGQALARLNRTAEARPLLTRALDQRRPLEHPGLPETQAELDLLAPAS